MGHRPLPTHRISRTEFAFSLSSLPPGPGKRRVKGEVCADCEPHLTLHLAWEDANRYAQPELERYAPS